MMAKALHFYWGQLRELPLILSTCMCACVCVTQSPESAANALRVTRSAGSPTEHWDSQVTHEAPPGQRNTQATAQRGRMQTVTGEI